MSSTDSNCPYYQSYKYCMKADKEINDDLFDYYCMLGYSYTDCPIYNSRYSSSTGGCFITSACIKSKKLQDNCYELTILRWFRDNVLIHMPNGEQNIKEYYRIAPIIVKRINDLSDSTDVYNHIYTEWIAPCVALIDGRHYTEAYNMYCNMVMFLDNKYLKVGDINE